MTITSQNYTEDIVTIHVDEQQVALINTTSGAVVFTKIDLKDNKWVNMAISEEMYDADCESFVHKSGMTCKRVIDKAMNKNRGINIHEDYLTDFMSETTQDIGYEISSLDICHNKITASATWYIKSTIDAIIRLYTPENEYRKIAENYLERYNIEVVDVRNMLNGEIHSSKGVISEYNNELSKLRAELHKLNQNVSENEENIAAKIMEIEEKSDAIGGLETDIEDAIYYADQKKNILISEFDDEIISEILSTAIRMHDSLTSDRKVIEAIMANEYDFYNDGSIA